MRSLRYHCVLLNLLTHVLLASIQSGCAHWSPAHSYGDAILYQLVARLHALSRAFLTDDNRTMHAV